MTTPNTIPALPARGGDWKPWGDAIDPLIRSLPQDYVSQAGGSTVEVASPELVGLVVKGAVGQTANLAEFRDSSEVVLTRVAPGGSIETVVQTRLFQSNPAATALIVRGASGQTANLAEFQDSAGAVLSSINLTGRVNAGRGLAVLGADSATGTGVLVQPNASDKVSLLVVGAASQSVSGLIVRAGAAQTANLAEFQNSAGTTVALVAASGKMTVSGISNDGDAFNSGIVQAGQAEITGWLGATISATPRNTSEKGLVIKAKPSQANNLLEVQDSSGTFLSGFDASGRIATNHATTGAVGAYSGKISVMVAGQVRYIPYYVS